VQERVQEQQRGRRHKSQRRPKGKEKQRPKSNGRRKGSRPRSKHEGRKSREGGDSRAEQWSRWSTGRVCSEALEPDGMKSTARANNSEYIDGPSFDYDSTKADGQPRIKSDDREQMHSKLAHSGPIVPSVVLVVPPKATSRPLPPIPPRPSTSGWPRREPTSKQVLASLAPTPPPGHCSGNNMFNLFHEQGSVFHARNGVNKLDASADVSESGLGVHATNVRLSFEESAAKGTRAGLGAAVRSESHSFSIMMGDHSDYADGADFEEYEYGHAGGARSSGRYSYGAYSGSSRLSRPKHGKSKHRSTKPNTRRLAKPMDVRRSQQHKSGANRDGRSSRTERRNDRWPHTSHRTSHSRSQTRPYQRGLQRHQSLIGSKEGHGQFGESGSSESVLCAVFRSLAGFALCGARSDSE
jgi:hypothetical protein